MKNMKIVIFIALIYLCTYLLSGCWNYREVEQLAIVSGVAIDKAGDDKFLVTVEIVNVQQEQKQSTLKPVYIQAVGNTFFEAARSIISLQGKRLYWSHAKIIIISEDIAREGISNVLDFVSRDAEVREDIWIILSREKTASEIFNVKPEIESILSYQLEDTLRAQKSTPQYPAVELYDFLDMLANKETPPAIPTIRLLDIKGKSTTYLGGAAIIKRNKLLGYLGEYEVESLLWIQNKLKDGVFIVKDVGETDTNVTLEIFKSKTKLKPEVAGGKLIMRVVLTVNVNIGEIMGSEDFISEKGRNMLQKDSEKQIRESLESLIEKAQKKYKTDFLGFGEKIKRSMPKVWKSIESQWDEIFVDMETRVEVNVRIKGSATTKKPIKAVK